MGLTRQCRDIVEEAWRHLLSLDGRDTVYMRGDALCRLRGVQPLVEVVGKDAMLALLVYAANWLSEKAGRKGTRWDSAVPPWAVVTTMCALPPVDVLPLESVARVPVLGREGRVIQGVGYHRDSSCWYEPIGPCEPIPDQPTLKQAREALHVLCEPLCDYQFEDEADRAMAVAMLLTPALRKMVGLVPLFVIDSPERGSGKSKLAAVVAHLSGVGQAGVLSWRSDRSSEEVQKQITALLLQAAAVIVIDNVKGRLDSSEFETALTADVWMGRVLGESRIVSLPQQAIWIVTSNNAVLGEDLARRSVRVRINARCEQPWLRRPDVFRHPDLLGWVESHVMDLARAAAIVCRGWVTAGRPGYAGHVLGSFERWCTTVGAVLQWLGVAGFLADAQEAYRSLLSAADDMRAFVLSWGSERLGEKMSCKELVDWVTAPEWDGILERVSRGETERARQAIMSRIMRDMVGRTFGWWTVRAGRNARGRQVYWVERSE